METAQGPMLPYNTNSLKQSMVTDYLCLDSREDIDPDSSICYVSDSTAIVS